MAVSSVKLIVDAANAVNPLKRVAKETAKTEKQVGLLQKAIKAQSKAVDVAKTKLIGFGNASKKAFATAQRAAEKLQAKLGGLKGAIIGLGAAALTKRMIGQAASFAQTQVRLKALSSEYGEFGQIQKLVKENAETFNQSQAESASNFADVFARLRPLGTSLEDIQTVYKGFNATALASGTSAAAASGAFLQLSQALGSGRLQGDEFRSIAEQVPGILRLVSDEMGVTVGELKKLGSDGKITSDILINSLAKGFEENKDKIQQLLAESPAQKFKEFSNATSELSNSIGTELLPVVTPAVEGLTEMVGVVGKLPAPMRTLAAAGFGLAAALTAASGAANLLGIKLKVMLALAGKIALFAAPFVALGLVIEDARLRKEEFDKAMESTSPTALEQALDKATKELDQLTIASKKYQDSPYYKGKIQDINDLKTRLDEAKLKVEELTKRRSLVIDLIFESNAIAEDVRRQTATGRPGGAGFDTLTSGQLDEALGRNKPKPTKTPSGAGKGEDLAALAQQQIQALKDQASLAAALNEEEVRRVQLNIDLREIVENAKGFAEEDVEAQIAARIELEAKRDAAIAYKDAVEATATAEEKARKDRKKAEEDARKERENDPLFQMQERFKKLIELKSQVEAAATSIGTAFSNAFVDVISGTKSVSEAAADMLKSIASDFLAMAKKIIAQQLIMILYQTILKALGGGGIGFNSNAPSITGNSLGDFGGGTPFAGAFAEGGYVTGPTNALIGEGGEPEYVIPESKMRESMGRYSRGSRGGSVIPAEGGGSAGAEGGVAVATPIDVRYTVERINSVDYVTADQFQAGMRQATQQGAAQGENRALAKLRNSPGARRKIGL